MSAVLSLWLLAVFLTRGHVLGGRICGGKPADVVFVLDASTSIWAPDFNKQLTFVREVIDEFDLRPSMTRCALLTFSDRVRVEFDLDQFRRREDVRRAIEMTRQLLGGTRTDLALAQASRLLEAAVRAVPTLVVVLTDGESTYPDRTAQEAGQLKERGVAVLAVGIGRSVNEEELRTIASSEDNVLRVDGFDALMSIRRLLAIRACSAGIQADGPPPVTPPTKGCDGKPADVIFALDASSSVWEPDFRKQLAFVRDVIRVFPVSENETRVGVMTFGDRVHRHFRLDEHTDEPGLLSAIGRIGQSRGNTNTAEAIRAIQNELGYARPGVVRIGVVITDGRSDKPRDTAKRARLARKHGIHLFAIGVGDHVDQRELYNIASQPAEDHVFEVDSYRALDSIKHLLAMKTCQVTEPPTTATPTTTTMASTTTTPPIGCSAQLPADIVFAMPPEVSSAQSEGVLRLIRNVTSGLDLDGSAVRLGVAARPCRGVSGFSLKEGGVSKEDVAARMTSLPVKRFRPADVIKHMRDVSFRKSSGAKQSSSKIGVMFVDADRGSADLIMAAAEMPRMRTEGIELVVVGVGHSVSETGIDSLITDELKGNVMISRSFADLAGIADSLRRRFDDICAENTVDARRR